MSTKWEQEDKTRIPAGEWIIDDEKSVLFKYELKARTVLERNEIYTFSLDASLMNDGMSRIVK